MNKKLLLIIIFIFSFICMPVVFAEELPREGVTYFMQYPDGSEDATESYDVAINPEEKLIYSGTTDSNGQLVLEGFTQGTVRVKEVVPEGYSTNARETVVNLSENRNVEFTNTYGFINPQTSNTLLMVIVVLSMAIGVTIYIKKTDKKKTVLPLLLIPLLAITYNVKADNNLTITIKDSFGNAQKNVAVEVYAKPFNVEAAPAIKVDANGGHFFDGKTLMYVRIPHNDCTQEELTNSLTEEQNNYYEDNIAGAYRDGYAHNGVESSNTFSNGTTIKVNWIESEYHVVTYHGNGGTFDFYGKQLTDISYGPMKTLIPMQNDPLSTLRKTGEYFIGMDDNKECNSFDQFGLLKEGVVRTGNPSDIYVCWNSKPDGIYVNDTTVFVGSDATCFNDSDNSIYNGRLNLYNYLERTELLIDNTTNNIRISKLLKHTPMQVVDPIPLEPIPIDPGTEIVLATPGIQGSTRIEPKAILPQSEETPVTKIEIVREGQTIITLTQDDLLNEEYDNYSYVLNDTNNANNFRLYMNRINDMCIMPD